MILFTAWSIRVLLLIGVIVFILIFRRKKKTLGEQLLWACMMVLFAVAAQLFSGLMPPVRDEVTLTALGERREEASAEEVYLAGYTVDGKSYLAGQDMKILDGKWFWKGETYCWRIETDVRQPEGTTRSITVGIPVGWNRTLNFEGNDWRGMVEISAGGNTQTVDTFSGGETVTAFIGRSSTSALILNQVRYLAAYAFCLLGLCCLALAVKGRMERDTAWKEKNTGKLAYGAVAIITFILMVRFADRASFWSDELWHVSLTNMSLKDMLWQCLIMSEISPPLAMIIDSAWRHIAPYGEQWLLLVSIVPVVIAVYVLGLAGEKASGRFCGFLAALFLAINTCVWYDAAYEFRVAAYMVMFSSLAIYTFILRSQNTDSKKYGLLFSLSMLGLAMSHYFGMMACAFLFLADCYLIYNKHFELKKLCSYILPGAISATWLVAVLVSIKKAGGIMGSYTWQGIPTVAAVKNLLDYLGGNNLITDIILFVGLAAGPIITFQMYKGNFSWNRFYIAFFAMMILGPILLMFVYGRLLYGKFIFKSTMWYNRYFLFQAPYAGILPALVIVKFVQKCGANKAHEKTVLAIICTFFVLYCGMNSYLTVQTFGSLEPYREAADWIYEQVNSIFNDDTVIINAAPPSTVAWKEYYIEREGRRDPLNVTDQIPLEEMLSYNTVFVSTNHGIIRQDLQEALDNDYYVISENATAQVKVYEKK